MAESPIDAFCTWFESLPPGIADELASALMQLFPGGPLVGSLTAKLRELRTSPTREAGLAISIAALTDFVFLERTDPSSWEQSEALLDVLDEAQSALEAPVEGLEEWIAEARLRSPLRARQWQKAGEGWRQVRGGPLEPQQVQRFVKEAKVLELAPKDR